MTDFEELKAKYAPEPSAEEAEAPAIPGEADEAEAPVIPGEAPEGAEPKDLTPSEDILSEAKNLTSDSSRGSEDQETTRDPAPEGPGMAAPSPEPKKRKSRFWKIYAIVTALAAMLICGLLGFFWQYLKEYEETRPVSVAKEAVTALAAGEDRDGFMPEEAGDIDRAASVAEAYAAAGGTANAEIVEKVGISTEDAPVFSVREDGREICLIRLRSDGKRRFFVKWVVNGVTFPEKHDVDITLTADTRLKLNGVTVGGEYVVSRDEPLPGYEEFADITPKCVRYSVEGLIFEPEMALENDYCYPAASEKNGVWTVTYPGPEDSREDAVELAYSAAKAYVTYASSQDSPFAPLDKYLIPDSILRQKVLSFNRKYFTRHDSASFENMEALDFSVYGADEFSVKLSFDYVMRNGSKTQTEKTVMTLFMLRYNGDWKIASVISE